MLVLSVGLVFPPGVVGNREALFRYLDDVTRKLNNT